MVILNIDDDSEDREMFCDALKIVDPNIHFVPMDSGRCALDFLDDAPISPDYIFIDINMPKMNGYECLEQILCDRKNDSSCIIMYSTTFDPKDKAKFEKRGIKHLSKCGTFSGLVDSLQQLISSPNTLG